MLLVPRASVSVIPTLHPLFLLSTVECASRPLESTRAYLDARYNVVMAKEERRALKKAKTMFFQRPSMDTKQLRMRWGKEAQIGFLAAVVCSVLTTVSKGNGFRCLRWDALPRLLELQPDDGNIFIRGGFSSFP
mmetsp:Transcript_30538/g.79258  ORF Transcript_30538/g.79258 Transcript_30538/m.79258 type:complete len:134 (+) Transcript_30538:1300-1701(+)